jgi:uncharacterized DUF497 family protein
MQFEWDSEKADTNLAKHGVAFDLAKDFDFATALEYEDRDSFGEMRIIAIGWIGALLYYMSYTERGEAIRVISLRRATKKEARTYAENI